MEPIIIEIRLSPDTATLLKSFAPAPHPITPARTTQQTRPVSAPAQVAPAAVPTAPTSPTQAYSIAPANPQPPTPAYTPQQYQPHLVNPTPAPRPAAPVVPVAAAPTAPMPTGPSTAQPADSPSNPPTQAPTAAAPADQINDLARAAAQLMDAGKQQECIALLQQFQVQGLRDLKPEQFGAFATALRQLGARI